MIACIARRKLLFSLIPRTQTEWNLFKWYSFALTLQESVVSWSNKSWNLARQCINISIFCPLRFIVNAGFDGSTIDACVVSDEDLSDNVRALHCPVCCKCWTGWQATSFACELILTYYFLPIYPCVLVVLSARLPVPPLMLLSSLLDQFLFSLHLLCLPLLLTRYEWTLCYCNLSNDCSQEIPQGIIMPIQQQ